MFNYYLASLHEFREKNLALGRSTSKAWLAFVAHMLDGQYLIGKAALHPPTLQPDFGHPGAHWEIKQNEDHKDLVLKWIDDGIAKANQVHETIFASLEHNTTGWSTMTHEAMDKLRHDTAPEFAATVGLIDKTMKAIAETEAKSIAAVSKMAQIPDLPVEIKPKPIRRAAAAKTNRRSAQVDAKK